uniref:NADH-ubiquinone oxidoreductase chain 2 n=1 Tax=Laemophloeidae sp. KM-2017 TaxID=2219439 RepID=A0A346RHH4_9CUCU|nr:NADH dehydrogenase subunit 2 [Laemophloeidae sp. KM-2017]
MFKLSKFLFLNTLIAGTFITISAYSWFSMWLGLEINLLSIIPLLNSTKNSFPSEAALKYFITQSMASTVIMFAIISLLFSKDIFENNFSLILNSAILTKMGAAPFHFWFPEIIEGLSWMNSLIILTWQKIAPMILIFYFIELTNFFIFIIIVSSMIGSIMGLNQINLRKILAYSSINHIAWLLCSLLDSFSIWMIYFSIYSIILMTLIFILNKIHAFQISQLMNMSFSNKMMNLSIFLIFFSLGGLPPFLGFLPKWLVINALISNNYFILSFLLIIFTLITLFYYIRVTFLALIISWQKNFTIKINLNYPFMWMILSFNFTGLIWCSLIFLNF